MDTLISFAAAHPKVKPLVATFFCGMSLVILLISFHLNFQQHSGSAILSGVL